jgi:hypothetical protein
LFSTATFAAVNSQLDYVTINSTMYSARIFILRYHSIVTMYNVYVISYSILNAGTGA